MFCTVIVNTLLIAGIFVSSSRRSSESKVVSPSPEADKTNVPSAEYSAKERSIILQRLQRGGGGGGGEGTPIHYLYGYVPSNGIVILKLLI